MKFAQSSAVYFNYSLQYAIENLGEIGYDGIEIWGGRPHMYKDDLVDENEQLRSLIRSKGMEVCNFIVDNEHYDIYSAVICRRPLLSFKQH